MEVGAYRSGPLLSGTVTVALYCWMMGWPAEQVMWASFDQSGQRMDRGHSMRVDGKGNGLWPNRGQRRETRIRSVAKA